MLTSALFAFALICGTAGATAAEETKVLALGLTDHEVTQEELETGASLAPPRFNSPGIAYALVSNLKKGDVVEVALVKDGQSLMHNAETLADDQARFLLQAGKRGVPAGGWPAGEYRASVEVTRDGTPILEQTGTPTAFD